VKWPVFQCHTKNQTAWAVLIIRIIFDDLTRLNGVAYFPNTDVPQNTLINCMLRKLEETGGYFFANLVDHSLRNILLYSIIHGIPFNSFEAGAVDHFDDLLIGHFYFAIARVAVG